MHRVLLFLVMFLLSAKVLAAETPDAGKGSVHTAAEAYASPEAALRTHIQASKVKNMEKIRQTLSPASRNLLGESKDIQLKVLERSFEGAEWPEDLAVNVVEVQYPGGWKTGQAIVIYQLTSRGEIVVEEDRARMVRTEKGWKLDFGYKQDTGTKEVRGKK